MFLGYILLKNKAILSLKTTKNYTHKAYFLQQT
nr:MAG TPA: hypothetical protein [Bacteriophage sp.]DAU40853.1 MAG TPA: hypothetical protein [Caudoviricetes sp.]